MSDQSSVGQQVTNALKLVANVAIIPGSGQLVEGKVAEGVMYGAAGLAGRLLLSPLLGPLFWVPWVAVGLDSFSKSVEGKHLWELGTHAATPSAPASSRRQ